MLTYSLNMSRTCKCRVANDIHSHFRNEASAPVCSPYADLLMAETDLIVIGVQIGEDTSVKDKIKYPMPV